MALTASEVARIRLELGYNGLSTAAEPYVSHLVFFEQVMQKFLLNGATTTSSTNVAEVITPVPVTLSISSAAGFSTNQVVVVDVDDRQERATVSAVNGSSIVVQLSRAHGPGPYPVTVEGAESTIRDLLTEIRGVVESIKGLKSRVGLRKVDDVEFFGGGKTLASQGRDPLSAMLALREDWRDELATAIGIERLNAQRSRGSSDMVVY